MYFHIAHTHAYIYIYTYVCAKCCIWRCSCSCITHHPVTPSPIITCYSWHITLVCLLCLYAFLMSIILWHYWVKFVKRVLFDSIPATPPGGIGRKKSTCITCVSVQLLTYFIKLIQNFSSAHRMFVLECLYQGCCLYWQQQIRIWSKIWLQLRGWDDKAPKRIESIPPYG